MHGVFLARLKTVTQSCCQSLSEDLQRDPFLLHKQDA